VLSRKDEIVNWFRLNDTPENFIIIDDDNSLHALPHFLKEKWVQPKSFFLSIVSPKESYGPS